MGRWSALSFHPPIACLLYILYPYNLHYQTVANNINFFLQQVLFLLNQKRVSTIWLIFISVHARLHQGELALLHPGQYKITREAFFKTDICQTLYSDAPLTSMIKLSSRSGLTQTNFARGQMSHTACGTLCTDIIWNRMTKRCLEMKHATMPLNAL